MEKTVISGTGFWPIKLVTLRDNYNLGFDLYIKTGSEMILYHSETESFNKDLRKKLIESGINTIYTPITQHSAYHKYIESHIGEILNDSSIDGKTKAKIALDTSQMLVKDILECPTFGENIKRGQAIVEVTVDFILKDKNAFANLVKVMSFDYQVFTHSVNVCTFSIALAKFMGTNDEESLNNLGVGALLHDVGKTKIPENILNKQDALTEEEFELIKKHPVFGQEIVKETDLIHKECYLPIGQHHERDNGSGYPHSLKAADIHEFSKIVAIADVFDAMTTQRCYRNAVDTFPALMVMFGEKNEFDKRILDKFTKLMGPRQMTGD